MGLLDVLNGMQQGPRGPSNPSAQSSGGMSPMTMAILGLLAWKAVKHFSANQSGASPAPAPSPATTTGGMGDVLKGGLGGLLAGGAELPGEHRLDALEPLTPLFGKNAARREYPTHQR